MAKRLVVVLVAMALTVTISTPAAADPLPPLTDTLVGIVKVIPLPTLPFGPTDIDPTTLVVTDNELAGAGQLLPSLSETEPAPSSGIVALAVDRGLPFAMASGLVGLAAGLLSPLVAAVVVGIASQTVTSGATLVVDDDKVQCPSATYTKISDAVAAANPGDTIQVCAGTYPESVTIAKTLIIQAVPAQDLATSCQGPTPLNVNPAQQSIVQFNTSTGIFNVQADNVVIDGFIIQANSAGPGISTSVSNSGYQIRNNVIQDNTPNGLNLNSSGASPTNVNHNCFREDPAGSVQHRGIRTENGLKNATIQNNFFTGEPEASISIAAGAALSQASISIVHNSIVDDQSIEFLNTSNGLIQNNLILRTGTPDPSNVGPAIILAGDTNSEVSFNKLADGKGNGIAVFGGTLGFLPTANSNLKVTKNKTTGFVGSGIKVDGPAGGTSVQLNKSESNAMDGIRVEATSSGYVIDRNGMTSNGDVDCFDASSGSGTAGTGNTWTNDKGSTQNFDPNIRGSICKRTGGP